MTHRKIAYMLHVVALALILCLNQAETLSAQNASVVSLTPVKGKEPKMLDTLNIRFHVNRTDIELDFADNQAHIDTFIAHFRQRYAGIPADSLKLDIYAGASPEGTFNGNIRLGQGRGEALRDLLRERLKGEIGHFRIINEGGRWQAFYDNVYKSQELWRNEVLYIIMRPPGTNPDIRDPRETMLREMWGGVAWPDILDNYLAPLRSSGSAIVGFLDPERDAQEVVVDSGKVSGPEIGHGGVSVIPVDLGQAGIAPAGIAPGFQGPEPQEPDDSVDTFVEVPLLPDTLAPFFDKCWAIKTNFLLWGVVAPNVQVEIPLFNNNRWSIEAEYFHPWFIWADNARAHECINLGVELRYWLGKRWQRPWLDGWHVGIAAAAGYYDFEVKKHEGYQGEHLNTYINLGYQHRFSHHWALEMAVGFGALITKNRHYYGGSVYPEEHLEPRDEHLIWHNNERFNWFGPNHAAFSIVYTIDYKRSAQRSERIRRWRQDSWQQREERKLQRIDQKEQKKLQRKQQQKLKKEQKAARKAARTWANKLSTLNSEL